MTVVPGYTGTDADHDDAPTASPASPLDELHRTAATATSSVAVPASVSEEVLTVRVDWEGEVMRSVGAVRSPVGGGGAGAVGATGVVTGVAAGGCAPELTETPRAPYSS